MRQLHILHGCISRVNLTLELSRLLVQIRDNKRHITEYIGVDDGTNSDKAGDEGDLERATRQNIVASQ